MHSGEELPMIERQLQTAEELVASGLEHIVVQNRIVGELKGRGGDTVAAEQLLNTLLEAQALHEEYRQWLRYEIERQAAARLRRTAWSFENSARNASETQPYTAVVLALSVGWLLGRSHCPL